MNPTSLVLAYYENAGQLRRQYALLRSMPLDIRSNLQVVIVDDGSPDNPAFAEDIGMPLEVYRIGMDIRWNQDAARNIGAKHAANEWLLLTDIDHEVPEKTWRGVIFCELTKTWVYRFSRVSAPDMEPYKPHPNSWFMTKATYERAGGYDERFAGWYGSDADFRDRASKAGPISILSYPLVRIPREVQPDASTTRYARKTIEDGREIKRIKDERARVKGWKPIRYRFPYERVA